VSVQETARLLYVNLDSLLPAAKEVGQGAGNTANALKVFHYKFSIRQTLHAFAVGREILQIDFASVFEYNKISNYAFQLKEIISS